MGLDSYSWPQLDAVDREIVRRRIAAHHSRPGPQVGDVVAFADRRQRRIARVCEDGFQPAREQAATS